ncbi:MAG: hypothetical protein SH809_05140 [Rhodothermales bacterium]|nr:hypothetical protein [Rhodothermales bacterium]
MTVPFLDRTVTGLHVDDTAIRRVDVARRLGLLRVRAVDTEPVADDGLEAALRRLADRLPPGRRPVAAALDPAHVWRVMLPPTDESDPEAEADRVREEVRRSLPEGLHLEDVVLRWARLPAIDGERLFVACARRDALADHLGLLRDAGLAPVSVGCLTLELGHAFAFDPAFTTGPAALLRLEVGGAELTRYAGGVLVGVEEVFDGQDGSAGSSLPPGTVVVPRADRPNALNSLAAAAPLKPIHGHAMVPALAAPAAALAVARLFPALPAIDFLEPAEARQARDVTDRREAVRVTAILGLILLLLVAGITGAEAVLRHRLAEAEAAVVNLAPQSDALRAGRAALENDRVRWLHVNESIAAPTGAAGALERIGRSVPAEVLLEGIAWEATDGERLVFSVAGRSPQEADFAALMELLEAGEPGHQVSLVSVGDGRFVVQVSFPSNGPGGG